MNMKKTIAAIAAGAMAVSAMATTVSAVSDQTLNYNLVRTHKELTSVKVTLSATFNDVQLSDGVLVVKVAIPDINYTWGGSATYGAPSIDSISVTGRYASDNKAIIPITRSSSTTAENYGATVKNGYLEITVGEGMLLSSDDKITFTVSAVVTHKLQDTWTDIDLVNTDIVNKNIWIGYKQAAGDDNTAANYTQLGDVVATAFSKTSDKPYSIPFQTGPSGNVNVAWYLQNHNVRDSGKDEFKVDGAYRNVLPVLNDAIANYETVTFTFNTAVSGIRWVAKNDYGKLYGTDEAAGGYNAALTAAGGIASDVTPVYDSEWNADNSYTSFTQHLYNGTDRFYGAGAGWGGYTEDYLGFDWAGQNLFGGALVINENLTMSLSDVDYFDWTATTLSFDWDAIMDGAATSNNYATYVQSIKLATSTIWYWDSMDVVLVAGAEGGDAASDAGTTGEEEELGEEEIDGEEIIDEPEEEPEEEPADEPAPEVVEVATTPATGNAPVALAVIPVALAAAAIVAKKRG